MMGRITIRAPNRAFKLWAAGLALAVAMLTPTLVLPLQASADCLTGQDHFYIGLLAQKDIGPAPGYTVCDVALHGRQIASAVRASVNPLATAASIARDLYLNTDETMDQAIWQVAAAIRVYAPEMIPEIQARTPLEPNPA